MKYFTAILLFTIIAGCSESRNLELLHKQAQIVNEGIEILVNDRLMRLAAAAAEYPYGVKSYYKDLKFYYDNTFHLIDRASSESDSLILWRLTKTKQATKYGFEPQLDSTFIFGNDSVIRKSALLLNLYNYISALSRSISICGRDYGLYPQWDKSASSPSIKLFGDPASSFIDGIVMGANISNNASDTMPLLGTLILSDTVDTTLRPLGK